MSYKHLSLEERYYIEIELRKGTSVNAIAKALRRSQGTISKEIQRNKGRGVRLFVLIHNGQAEYDALKK